MILDFLSTSDENVYDGVEESTKNQRLDMSMKHPSILIARTIDDVHRCLTSKKYQQGIRAVALMTNDGPEAWESIDKPGFPFLIIGQQLGLPEGIKYTGVSTGDRKKFWGDSQIIQRGNRYYLTPQFVQREPAFKWKIDPELPIGEIAHNRKVRAEVLGSFCMPRTIKLNRISTGTGINEATIVVNPK